MTAGLVKRYGGDEPMGVGMGWDLSNPRFGYRAMKTDRERWNPWTCQCVCGYDGVEGGVTCRKLMVAGEQWIRTDAGRSCRSM